MNYGETITKLANAPQSELLDLGLDKNEKEQLLNSREPISIVHGVCNGDYELKDVTNPKSISAISIPGKKGVNYLAVFKGDWNIRLLELDKNENGVKLYKY